MALTLDFPTANVEKNAENYWTALYNYFTESPLNAIFDFTDLVIDTETYSNTGFSFSYKSSTPLYQVANASPDVFSLVAADETLSTINFSQTLKLSSYAPMSASYDTSNFEKDVPIKIAKSENCIYMFLFGTTMYCPFLAFDDSGFGCAGISSKYNTQMIYAAGSPSASSIVFTIPANNYNKAAAGESRSYYLKPVIKGSAVFNGLLALDGGPNTNNFSGDFQFNGADYWGFAYCATTNNFVLKL